MGPRQGEHALAEGLAQSASLATAITTRPIVTATGFVTHPGRQEGRRNRDGDPTTDAGRRTFAKTAPTNNASQSLLWRSAC
jgi:hypothetical protein